MAARFTFRKFGALLQEDRSKFIALFLFLAATFLLGGGSRDDILSLVFLRPLAIFFAAYALSVASPGDLKSLGMPLWLLLALLLLMIVQLVPLPPRLWADLPGREAYDAATAAAGLGDVWRPLSLSPSKTINSIFALTVPVAALMLFAVQSRKYLRPALLVILAMGLGTCLWGLLQLMGSATGPLYLYRITNAGLPVGLFANRNHQGTFLAALIPLVAYIVATASSHRGGNLEKLGAVLAALLFVPAILLTGSRAGILSLLIALCCAVVVFLASDPVRSASTGAKPVMRRVGAVAAGLALVAAIVAAVALWFGRALAIERLLTTDHVEDLRRQLLPVLLDMSGSFFPAGAGFGAFEHVYDRFEPLWLLKEQYLNQAHNDWLQLLIEGGLPAALILLVFLMWLARQLLRLRETPNAAARSLRIAALSFIAIIGFASIFDYPLRIPSIMAVFAIFCAILARRDEVTSRRLRGADATRAG